MEDTHHIKILYVLVLLLLVGLIGLAYLNTHNMKSIAGAGATDGPASGNTSTTVQADLSTITVGDGGVMANSVAGTITSLSGAQMQLKDATQGATDIVSINTNTKFEIAGKLKDPATIQKDLAAYNAQVALLMKDPIANKAALAALQVPSTQTVTPATLADFRVGDQVLVAATSIDASGTSVEATITKNPVQ
jgi:hypothetical protein